MLRSVMVPWFTIQHRSVSSPSEMFRIVPLRIFCWPIYAFRRLQSSSTIGCSGALLVDPLCICLPPGGKAAAYSCDALRCRGGNRRRYALSLALFHSVCVVTEGPGEVRIAGRELLAGAVQRRSPSRPRRSSSPPNLCSARARVDANIVLPPSLVLRVHGGRWGHDVRQVEPRRRSHPCWNPFHRG